MNRPETMATAPADRLLVRYRIEAEPARIEARASALALEQSVEMPAHAIADAAIRAVVPGRVEEIAPLPAEPGRPGAFEVDISLAATTIGDDPGQLLNMLFGNCSLQTDVRLVDARLPDSLLAALPGPAFGIAGLRAACGAGERPLSCTALKPQGMAPEALADLAGRFARAGIDVIKDDHGIAEQAVAPFEARVPAVQRAIDAANRATGGRTIYAPNLAGGPGRLTAQLRVARDAGVGALLACPMILGAPVFAELLRAEAGVPLIAHPALAGTAIAPALLLGRLFRAFGADATIFPNHGGRFGYSLATCKAIAAAAREPLGNLHPAMPVPAGGMRVDRVDEMLALFGPDTMLLIGGNLLEAGDGLEARAAAFATRVREAGGDAGRIEQ
ncbi:MAG: RuBisCO large subunit C-terminal-like domain-containing protein [Burkholderiaceae bacterium]|jgi:ribulose-bisphosphate carboxylase large chain|nr:RuBisCO large subunit C-terminal-like domain-containing protein [Burkholderiaceae bacterium]